MEDKKVDYDSITSVDLEAANRFLAARVKSLHKQISKLTKDLAAARQHPLATTLDNTRNHASRQRISQLERENAMLREKAGLRGDY